MAILKPRADTKTKVLGLRIPAALHAEYERTRQAAHDAGLVFSVNELLTQALTRFLIQAHTELQQRQISRQTNGDKEA